MEQTKQEWAREQGYYVCPKCLWISPDKVTIACDYCQPSTARRLAVGIGPEFLYSFDMSTEHTIKLGEVEVGNVRSTPRKEGWLQLYCGRGLEPHGMTNASLGNPFRMEKGQMTREVAVDRYRDMLEQNTNEAERHMKVIRHMATRIKEGVNIQLFCWCAPKACHCDVIREKAQEIAAE